MDSELVTISEFAKLSGINRKTLIYYDEIGLFPPAKKGKNGYRYYSYYQLDLISFIWIMRDMGMPLMEIKKNAEQRTPDNLLTLLKDKKHIIDEQIEKLNQISASIEMQSKDIEEGKNADINNINLVECSEQPIFLGAAIDGSKYDPFKGFFEYCSEHGFLCGFPMGELMSWNEFNHVPKKRKFYYKTKVSMSNNKKDAGMYITAYCFGRYSGLAQILERFKDFMSINRLTAISDIYIEYLLNEVSISDPNDYVTKFSMMVE